MDVRGLRIALASAAALLLGMAGAAPAQAAFGMTINDADPASTNAGANSNFHLDISFTGLDDVKDLTVHLPPGLVGDPTSTPLCTEAQLSADDCPEASKIGTTTTYANLLDLTPLTIPGEVFNVKPRTGEPARLGIVLTPPIGAKVILQSAAKLRADDFGLDTVLEDIPNSADGLPITITRIELTLNGAFMRNPTSCGTKTTTADATSYAATTATGSNSFTSVNCAALPFSPSFEASLGSPGHTDAFTYPPQTTVISQVEGEAGLRRAQVKLPDGIAGDTAYLFANACSVADFQAHSCADNTVVGQATAESPLQEEALTGPVVLVENGGDFPRLGLDLEGALALQLYGDLMIDFLPGGPRVNVVFDGLPDIPISRFELLLDEDRLNYAGRDLCDPPPLVYETNFTSHGDVVLDDTAQASVVGCGDEYEEPTGSATLRGATGSKPRLRVRVDAGGAGIDELVVNAPRKARFAKSRIVAKADGQKQPATAIARTKKALTISLDAADEVRVKLSRGALKLKKSVKPGDQVPFSVDVTDTAGRDFTLATPATARR